MTIKPLDRLRAAVCTDFCTDQIDALGLRCGGFTSCEECKMARNGAADGLVCSIERRLIPEGMEWPVFENGEKVRIGDEITLKEKTATVDSIQIHREGVFSLWYDGDLASATYFDGAPVKRPEPEDTQERIYADAEKGACSYFGWYGIPCSEKGGCPACGRVDCDAAKTLDLLRRQRELDAKKAGA